MHNPKTLLHHKAMSANFLPPRFEPLLAMRELVKPEVAVALLRTKMWQDIVNSDRMDEPMI